MSPPPDLETFSDLVRSRRTSMLVDAERPVPPDLVDRLCELATWAPNHKRTWPWRFASFSGAARLRLGETFVADMRDRGVGDPGKQTKTLTKYARTPTVLVVGCAAHDHPTFHAENRDAVAAGVQNLLLGATTAGLASFWSTPPVPDGARALALCGFEPDARLVAVIYLGWSTSRPAPPARPAPHVLHVE